MEHGQLWAKTISLVTTKTLGLVAAALCWPVGSALAGTITAYAGASGPGLGSVTFGAVDTPSPANDDVAGAFADTVTITEKRSLYH